MKKILAAFILVATLTGCVVVPARPAYGPVAYAEPVYVGGYYGHPGGYHYWR